MFVAILLASSLIAGQLQTPRFYPPRERYETPAPVQVSQRVMRTLMTNQVAPSYPGEAKRKAFEVRCFCPSRLTKKAAPQILRSFLVIHSWYQLLSKRSNGSTSDPIT